MLYLIKVYLAKKLSNLDSNMPDKFDSTFSSATDSIVLCSVERRN